jgi:predicted kinase
MNRRQQKELTNRTAGDIQETFYDYSGGRATTAELVVMVGISGSGKSTYVKAHIRWGKTEMIRINRDDLRKLMYDTVPWSMHKDALIRPMEIEMARVALRAGKTVYIDDTNCNAKTFSSWTQLAIKERVKMRVIEMKTPFEVCKERQGTRPEAESVPIDAVVRQYNDLKNLKDTLNVDTTNRAVFDRLELLAGKWVPRLPGRPWIICDIDGTLADHAGVRNQYDEGRVLHDNPYPVVVQWAQALYEDFNFLLFSGRKDKCCDDTCDWMEMHGVKYDRILMRARTDNRKDAIVKKELLDDLMTFLKPEDIAFILDDRPQVVRMWRNESEVEGARHNYGRLTVYPVRGALEEF